MNKPILYIVVPCYNEQEVLPETNRRLCEKLVSFVEQGRCSEDSRILYVDDGSKDNTWQLISLYHGANPMVSGLKLAHNKGHQNALFAGLDTAAHFCDCAVSMDADLQDDINVIDGFLEKYEEGYEVVYGVRSSRETDTAFKRSTAQWYYKIMAMLGVDLVYNSADCRLLGKRALKALVSHKEVNLFLRGIVPSIGYKNTKVYYERNERFAGESKYPLKKMLHLAWDGITSFSDKPLSLITLVGGVILALSIFGIIFTAFYSIFGGTSVVPVLLSCLGISTGLILGSLGITGSYIGKIYTEVKGRPRYIPEEFLK